MKPARTAVTLLTLLVASACASSYAEPNRPIPSAFGPPSYGESARAPVAVPEPWSDSASVPYSPYGVELVSGDFRRLPTCRQAGRAYVMGAIGERYRVRISNPTARRV